MHPGKPGKEQIHFPGPGNVLKFDKIRKCPGKNIACENFHLEPKQTSWIDIMSLEENFYHRRKRESVSFPELELII